MMTEPRPPDLDEADARVALDLLVSNRSFHNLIGHFGAARAALSADAAALAAVVEPARVAAIRAEREAPAALATARASLAGLGASALPHGLPGYPADLCALDPPPPVVYVRGALRPGRGVALVGTRRASGLACDLARDLAASVARTGETVVSGGAYGIDAAAHEGALEAGGHTTVVLAGGLDRPYPDRHIPLFERAARQGAVLSTAPPGTPPVRGRFLARNAVIAALARAVVVVEAPARSGARSTARAAERLGRTVLAVPGSPGTAWLLSRGATPIRDADGLRRALAGEAPRAAPPTMDDPVAAALRRLGRASSEDLVAESGQDPAAVMAALLTGTLAGTVAELPDGSYLWAADLS
jgi:DNA processing protein